MDPNLIIVDEYIERVGGACKRRGKDLEEIVDSYLTILTEIKDAALVSGQTADALSAFIECVALLNDRLTVISDNIDKACDGYIQDINEADAYLF